MTDDEDGDDGGPVVRQLQRMSEQEKYTYDEDLHTEKMPASSGWPTILFLLALAVLKLSQMGIL